MPDGIPSPNPQFPQQIKNVTGNANEKIQNKNFVDGSKTRNQYVNSQGVFINSDYDLRSDYIKVENNKNYILSAYNSSFNRIYRLYQVAFYDKNKTFLSKTSLNYNTSFSVADESIEYVIVWQGVTTGQLVPEYLQLEQGTTATSYVEHQEQNYPFTFEEGQFLADNEKLQDNGMFKKWKQVTFSGTTITLEDAKTNGAYFCNKKVSGNLVDKTLTFEEEVTDAIIQYELETEEIIPYNETQQAQYNAIKQARSYDDITYISSTSDELGFNMDVESLANANKVIDSLDTRLLALESEV